MIYDLANVPNIALALSTFAGMRLLWQSSNMMRCEGSSFALLASAGVRREMVLDGHKAQQPEPGSPLHPRELW